MPPAAYDQISNYRLFRYLLIITFFSISLNGSAQSYPQNYFRAPLDIPLLLSGNFGELRSNHFHAGIDIKTNGQEGLPVYAAADGYVSRIKVSPYGYGKAIYIDHPAGYTTVYGHLSGYNLEISKFVESMQYQQESYDVEIFPDSNRFYVKKGDIIAHSGNTGGSGGPHLHFEIRESVSEIPLNPLLFGFDIPDHIPPAASMLYLYDLDKPEMEGAIAAIPITGSNGILRLTKQPPALVVRRLGVAIKAYDQMDKAPNHNGVYELQLYLDGEETFGWRMKGIAFDESRFINAHMDYALQQRHGTRIHKAFKLPGDKLSIYTLPGKDGVIEFNQPGSRQARLELMDVNKNKSVLNFEVTSDASQGNNKPYSYSYSDPYKYKADSISILIPAYSLYQNDNIRITETIALTSISKAWQIHDPLVPVHYHFDISIKCETQNHRANQLVMIHKDDRGRRTCLGGIVYNGWLHASSRDFGVFYVDEDDTKPVIRPGYKYGVQSGRRLKVLITDDLSGIASYRATVDGKWVLMEYDPKTNRLFGNIPTTFKPGTYDYVVKVTDEVGNEAYLTQKIKI